MDDGNCRRPSFLFYLLLTILTAIFLAACQPARKTITLALLGDINLGRNVNPSAQSFDYLAPDLEAADLGLANLESPLSQRIPASTSNYNLCAPAERADLLSEWGLDLLTLANNHSSDCGSDEAADTISALEKARITPIGPGVETVYRQVNGLRLAFLALDDVSSAVDVEAAKQAIRSAHEDGALVIVSIHWGMEYQEGASDRQEFLAQQLAGAGAALVWGHHPHVLQPAEWIDSKNGKTLILYSLGNALFDQPGLEDTRQSALALVALNATGVQSVKIVPFIIDVAHSRLGAPDDEAARKILERLKIK